jgi:hypothetical protein
MSAQVNPYAPPASQVERRGAIGEVFRKGKLIAMHREGQLPPRCIACNAAAPGHRISRTLYWTPPAWRWSMAAVIVLILGLTSAGVVVAAIAFWPVVIIATITNLIVRKRFPLDLAICERHRHLHTALTWAAALSLAAFVGAAAFLIGSNQIGVFGVLLLVMFALGIARSLSGALAVRVARLEGELLWLKGSRKAFRDSLPDATDT